MITQPSVLSPHLSVCVPGVSLARSKTRTILHSSVMSSLLCLGQFTLAQTIAPPATSEVTVKPVVPAKAGMKEIAKGNAKESPKLETKTEPTAAAPDNASDVTTITVTSNRTSNRIDRQVYDVKTDIANTTSSVADALNNVPSVTVDPNGAVSLRGRTNVQILVDGKPSAMLQGENRGDALRAMPAADIKSIEVINNPGAQFGNEGGGGPILNLVMNRNRRPGGVGSLNANVGTAGRYNSSLFGTYNQGRLGFQGGINVRHDGRNATGEVALDRLDPTTGAVIGRSAQTFTSTGLTDSAGINSTLIYNLSDKDTIGVNLSYFTFASDQRSNARYLSYGQDAALASDYMRLTLGNSDNKNLSWGARADHKGTVDGEFFKIDLRVSSSTYANDGVSSNIYAFSNIGTANSQSRQAYKTEKTIIDFTGDYELPIDKNFLKLGYKIARNNNSFDNGYIDIATGTLVETINTTRTNFFKLDETDWALYGSYELRLNQKWGVQGGLRVEKTSVDIQQLTTKLFATNDYINYIPSSFVSYKVSDNTTLRFSYAHRISRPSPYDLNPFVVYQDELHLSSGNPKLKPTQTDSFELGYESKWGVVDTNVRGYYRKDKDSISYRSDPFITADGTTVTLTTRDNAGSNRSGGLEFSFSGKALPKLTINASGNLAYTEQNTINTGGNISKLTAPSLNLRTRFNYQATESDSVQIALNAQGKTLSGQGYRQPFATADFSYRHTITPKLSLVMNVTDVFRSNKYETIIDTTTLKESSIRRYDSQLAYIGLSYRFGGVTPPSKPKAGTPPGTEVIKVKERK